LRLDHDRFVKLIMSSLRQRSSARPGPATAAAPKTATTHIVLESSDFIARLAALVPPTPRHVAMDGVRRLKRVFGIEI